MKKEGKERSLVKRIFIWIGITLGIVLLYAGLMMAIVPHIEIVKETHILGAHRGNSIDFIENTIPAFQSAVEEDRYKFIEFDLQYTRDKVIVIHHDKSLLRLQGKNIKIEDVTYEELLNISDYHIPTYEEVMNVVAGKKPINIEIKSQGDFEEDKELADFLIKDLKERGLLQSSLISSISNDVVRYINEKYEEEFCPLCEEENCPPCQASQEYWENIKIKTGKIYYVSPETFLQEIYPDSLSMISTMMNTGANYLMIHGVNTRYYKQILKKLPENSYLTFWYFTDEMYLVIPEIRQANLQDIFGINFAKEKILKSPEPEPCLWWCDSEF